MEEQKPTLGSEGASTLDRLTAYLSAEKPPEQQTQSPMPDGNAGDEIADVTTVETDDGAPEGEQQPQLTTSDLAKILGQSEDALDVDDDGNVMFKLKIDGKEVAPKLADILKSYQVQGHADNKAREVAEREKALQTKAQEVEQQFKQRLEYAEGLTNIAATQLMEDYKSINWQALEAENPGHAALLRQKFQDKQAQLRGVYQNIEQNRRQMMAKAQEQLQAHVAKEAERLVELIPEWKDAQVANKERAEIREWGLKQGFKAEEMDAVFNASIVKVLRQAMKHDQLQQKKPEIENKVRKALTIAKPGQPAQNGQAQKVLNAKQAVIKSGGKKGTLAAYLIASGKV